MIKVHVWHDELVECPNAWGGWKLVSFRRRDGGEIRGNRDDYDDDAEHDPEHHRMTEEGLMFWLDCYEHSGVEWSLHGHGMQCRWDTSHCCGVLVWSDDKPPDWLKTYDERKESARQWLEIFNEWLCGNCYGYTIEEEGHDDDSCGGFIGTKHLVDGIEDAVRGKPYEIETHKTIRVEVDEASMVIDEIERRRRENAKSA